jgi:hypothetical protein
MKKLNNFNDFINEGAQPHLLIYRGNTNYPYNYTVIRGDELYSVSFRKDKPFIFKYHGKINRDIYNPIGTLIKNPPKSLIMLSQTKLKPNTNESKINEEFEEANDIPPLDRVSFMNELKDKTEELLKNYPKDFKINYVPGKILTIGTGNSDDIKIIITFTGDKISFIARPTEGPEYQFDYNFDENGVQEIFNLIKSAIENDPHKGILSKRPGETYPADTDKPSKDVKEEDIEPLDIPITKKPKRRTRSININVIHDVLEDAYILDDIDLKDTDVSELIRRMLLETRRRKTTK